LSPLRSGRAESMTLILAAGSIKEDTLEQQHKETIELNAA
jgi:hypothetical protein